MVSVIRKSINKFISLRLPQPRREKMSRRAKQQITPLEPDEGYWQKFISSRFGSLESVEKVAEKRKEPSPVSDEMRIFAERLIYALCPPEKGYSPGIVREVKSIYDVLSGTKDFEEWFTNVRRMLSLKSFQLAGVLYQCLEGLRSKEARQLQEEWRNFIASELKGYGMM
jgi:hypothetical protein